MPLTVAVNLSPLDLFDSELPTYISGLLAEAALPASWLVLEITETAIMRDPAYALKILRDLKGRGIRIGALQRGPKVWVIKRFSVDCLQQFEGIEEEVARAAGRIHYPDLAWVLLGARRERLVRPNREQRTLVTKRRVRLHLEPYPPEGVVHEEPHHVVRGIELVPERQLVGVTGRVVGLSGLLPKLLWRPVLIDPSCRLLVCPHRGDLGRVDFR